MLINNPVSYKIWEDRYKKGDETLTENLLRVANYCSTSDEEYEEFYKVMNNTYFLPAGRTMSNAGIGTNLTLNNCFNSNFVGDSIEEIFDKVKLGALTHKRGGGIGYEFSQIRPKGSSTSNDAIASGVISFMDVFNTQTSTILQGGRRGANMGVLSIYHPDILEYIDAKSYDAGKLVHFN
jgi:ribonucleoside-diphosphate reductase alpha chain